MKRKGNGKAAGAAKANSAGKENRPVIDTARRVFHLLQNKVIGSVMLFGQGILFLVSPSGDVTPTIRLSAGILILVCLIVIFLHLRPKKKSRLDIAIIAVNGVLIAAAAFFLFLPEIIKPFVRTAVGGVTVITALVNLTETLKIRRKKDWKFIVSVVGALAIAALGIVTIAAGEESIAVMQRSIGAILILNAVVNIWYIIQLHQKIKKSR